MKHSKTEAGQQAFKSRSVLLSARQRSAFILFDGVKSDEQVLAATAGIGITKEDINHLVQQGLLVAAPEVSAALAPGAVGNAATETGAAEAGPVRTFSSAASLYLSKTVRPV